MTQQRPLRILCVASGGGHLEQMLACIDTADLEAAVRRAQQKARDGLTYEPYPERERLLAAIRAAVEGREIPTE